LHFDNLFFILGFVTHTFTAPIWFIKTRLQLNSQ